MAIFTKYPYLNLNDLNLDYIMRKLKEVTSAEGVSYDDAVTALGADNVQKAIEAMKTLIDDVALQSTNVIMLSDTIPASFWENGHTYTHLQTVNIPVLVSIIEATRAGKIIVLKQTDAGGSTIPERYIYLAEVEEDPNNLVHHLYFFDVTSNTVYRLNINGLNDEANVYVDIDIKVVIPYVNTFNGRDGAVLPENGDYDASMVDYDNTGSGLSADDVQSAIDEVASSVPSTYVESFNGRDGVVSPDSGDYDANQVNFDGSYSGLSATNVQDAIDEIADDILSAGVASFNSRTGAVNPQSGDYDASMIAVDTSNTNLPASVNTVQKYINYTNPASVTVTLTINGAMEDSITIKDSTDTVVGTCIFASGQTSGTATIDVPIGGGTYKFVSSVAKDTADASLDYTITVALTDNVTQAVNVYPSGAVYWYGNKLGYTLTRNDGVNTMTFTENTNDITYSVVSWGSGSNPYFAFNKTAVGVTNIGATYSGEKNGDGYSNIIFNLNGVNTVVETLYDNTDLGIVTTKSKEAVVANLDCDEIRVYVSTNDASATTNSLTLNALWID